MGGCHEPRAGTAHCQSPRAVPRHHRPGDPAGGGGGAARDRPRPGGTRPKTGRDAAAGRTDKPVATGAISSRAVWIAAVAAVVAALAMSAAMSVATALINAVIIAAGWAYNAGLKATLASGLMYLLGFGPIPAYAASTLPGHPAPRWYVTAAAALVGLGAHFANVLPDLAADRATGVKGLPQQVAARWGPGAVRAIAIVLLLLASVLLVLAASDTRRWVAITGLAAAGVL